MTETFSLFFAVDSGILEKRKISAGLDYSEFLTTEVFLSELRQSDVNDAMEAVWE